MRMDGNRWVEATGIIDTFRETLKAHFIRIVSIAGNEVNSKTFMWFPKSHMREIEFQGAGTEANPLDSFELTEWILSQKGYGVDLEQTRDTAYSKETKQYPPVHYDDIDDDIPF